MKINKMHDFSFSRKTNRSRIWIADDVCIETTKSFNLWHRFWLKIIFGWRIEVIPTSPLGE